MLYLSQEQVINVSKKKFSLLNDITHLLDKKGEVYVDGLGGFSKKYVSAFINRGDHQIHPPSADYQFNADAKSNSDLSEFVQESSGVSAKKAAKLISTFVENITDVILKEGSFLIPGIGNLSMSSGGLNLSNISNSASSFLPVVNAQTIVRSTEQKVKKIEQKINENLPPIYGNPYEDEPGINWWRWLKYILLALILLLLWKSCASGCAWVSSNIEDNNDVVVQDESTYTKKGHDEDELAIIDTSKEEQVIEPQECIIILGTFSKSKNVLKMMSLLKDDGRDVYEEQMSNGTTRVGFSYDCTHEDLPNYLRNIRKEYKIDAWYLSPQLDVY